MGLVVQQWATTAPGSRWWAWTSSRNLITRSSFTKRMRWNIAATHGREFDVIHASPPCQHYSWSAARWGRENYPDLVGPTRELLKATGKPYVIENVIGAPLIDPIILTGQMFGLKVIRRRQFESNLFMFHHSIVPANGNVKDGDYMTVAGHGGDGRAALHLWKDAMGIDWMTKDEITQAIPPAYTYFIGLQLQRFLQGIKNEK